MKLVINEDLDTIKSILHNTNIIRKVDSSGTINIPKSIREVMGIEANDEVYLYVDNTNNTIAIRKVNSDYTPEIGMAGFKFVESGFFTSGEAMDYVDNEFISKLDIDESLTEKNI